MTDTFIINDDYDSDGVLIMWNQQLNWVQYKTAPIDPSHTSDPSHTFHRHFHVTVKTPVCFQEAHVV